MKVIVVSLERAEKRRSRMVEQLDRLAIDYVIYPAFDASYVLNSSFTFPIIKGAGIGRKLNPGEICCTLSHISALKYAQVMGFNEVVVLEDDVVMCSDWHERLKMLLNGLPADWEYVYLSGHSDYVRIPMYEKPTVIKAPRMVSSFSYMVNRSGMEKVIKTCSEMTTTYDDMISHRVVAEKINGYVFIPYMTYHQADESYIWGETGKDHPSKYYFKDRI